MGIFTRRSKTSGGDSTPKDERGALDNQRLVTQFLRGQNLEQIGKTDEAVVLYEEAVEANFDAAGPYDRLIFIYQNRRQHADVVRVAEASLKAVRTHAAKRVWYEQQIEAAQAEVNASRVFPP